MATLKQFYEIPIETTSNIKTATTTTTTTKRTTSNSRNTISRECASNVRLLEIPKSVNGSCGFNLTRSKWDPYPWVNAVFVGTPAYVCGLKAGDCILEVNGGDVLGLRLADIAKLMHAKSVSVTLLLWNSGCQANCNDESIFCGPLPRNLTRLSAIVQSIMQLIECPICMDTIMPPTLQCQNGHLVCINCRIRSINCPICRDHFTPRRAKIAEQLHAIITSAFNLCENEDKLRQKLFGCTAYKLQQQHQQEQQQHIKIQPEKNQQQFNTNLDKGKYYDFSKVNKSQEINRLKSNMFKSVAMHFRTHQNTVNINSMANLDAIEKPKTTSTITSTTTTTTTSSNHVNNLKNDKNHLARAVDEKKEEQTLTIIYPATLEKVDKNQEKEKAKENKVKNKAVTGKKYPVSTNDLSELLTLGQQSPLKSSCKNINNNNNKKNDNNNKNENNSYSHHEQKQYVLITPDVPLIMVHGTKCVQNSVEMALDVKSGTSSSPSALPSAAPLSSITTLSLPTCLSQCTQLSIDSQATPSFTSASFDSNSMASCSSSSPSGILIEHYKS